MGIQIFGSYESKKQKRIKRSVSGIVIVALIVLAGAYVIGILTADNDAYRLREDVIAQNHELKQEIAELSDEVKKLKAELATAESATPTPDPDIRTSPRD